MGNSNMKLIGQKIELFVSDLEASTDFYGRVLGFEVGAQRQAGPEGNELIHVPVWRGPTMIGLGLMSRLVKSHHLRRGGLDVERGIGVEMCFYVDDSEIEAYYKSVQSECRTTLEPLVLQPWGARDFRVIDPDGYYLRFSTPDRDYFPLSVETR